MKNALIERLAKNPVEYRGVRTITLRTMDEVHERPEGTAGRNFRRHRDRMVEEEDYFVVAVENLPDEIRRANSGHGGARENLILLTESGYLLLVKSFHDDLAWKVQRKLVRTYFAAREAAFIAAEQLQKMLAAQNELINQLRRELDTLKAERLAGPPPSAFQPALIVGHTVTIWTRCVDEGKWPLSTALERRKIASRLVNHCRRFNVVVHYEGKPGGSPLCVDRNAVAVLDLLIEKVRQECQPKESMSDMFDRFAGVPN